MHVRWLIVAVSLGLVPNLCIAEDAFERAARSAIHDRLPALRAEQIQFLGTPRLKSPVQQVRIADVRFEPTLKRWRLRLTCVPSQACVPSIAAIASDEPRALKPDVLVPRAVAVHSGDRIQLVAEFPGLRMTIPVTCLETGAVGDRIRVRDANRKILSATVQADKSLKLRRTR